MNMKQERLENLTDGIFAIVMTLLVIELKVPIVHHFSTTILLHELGQFIPYLMSYVTSFCVLYIFWQTHHFIISVYAKNITVDFARINALFFISIGLIPFSSHFLALYHFTAVGVSLFSIHIIIISTILAYMRFFVSKSPYIENQKITHTESSHAAIRVWFPAIASMIALVVSIFNPLVSLPILTLGILFNFSKRSTKLFFALSKIK